MIAPTLHCAAEFGRAQAVRTLIDAKSNVPAANFRRGHVNRTKELSQHKRYQHLLLLAAACGNADLIRAFAGKAKVDMYEHVLKFTALHFAAINGHTAVVLALIDARADVNVTDMCPAPAARFKGVLRFHGPNTAQSSCSF